MILRKLRVTRWLLTNSLHNLSISHELLHERGRLREVTVFQNSGSSLYLVPASPINESIPIYVGGNLTGSGNRLAVGTELARPLPF